MFDPVPTLPISALIATGQRVGLGMPGAFMLFSNFRCFPQVLMRAGVDKDCTQGAASDYARRSYPPHLRISQLTLRVNDSGFSGG